MKTERVVEGTSCFSEHAKRGLTCQKKDCRRWMPCSESLNCSIVGAAQGEHTLQEIGDIFDVTRMRICQIEKTILSDLSILNNVKMTR